MGKLTLEFVNTVKEPGRHPDGNGLFLKVRDAGSKQWIWRGTIRGQNKRLEQGLGGYPDTSLAQARRKARWCKGLARAGKDPRERQQPDTPTFAEAVERFLSRRRTKWKQKSNIEDQWRRSLNNAIPTLGAKRIDEITSLEVMGVLLPIWATKTATARRALQRVGAIMKWAVAEGYREDNPVDDIRAVLPRQGDRYRRPRARRQMDEGYLADLLQRVGRPASSQAEEEEKLLDFMEWSIAKGPVQDRESMDRAEVKRIADSRDSRLWVQEIVHSETSPRAWAMLQGVVKYLWERQSPFLLVAPKPPEVSSPLWHWMLEVAMGIRKEPSDSSSGPKAGEKLYRDMVIAVTVSHIFEVATAHPPRPIYPSNKDHRSVCELVANRLRKIGESVTTERSVHAVWQEHRLEE